MTELTNKEVELRVFDIDEAERKRIQRKLTDLGAVALGEFTFRRAVMDVHPASPNRWIRVRSDGSTTTLAVKERSGSAADGEHEVVVSDFDETLKILKAVGDFTPRSIQENRRESYDLEGNEVVLDTWPIIGHVVEIEGFDEESVRRTADRLEIDASKLVPTGVEQVYKDKYGIDVKSTSITFNSKS